VEGGVTAQLVAVVVVDHIIIIFYLSCLFQPQDLIFQVGGDGAAVPDGVIFRDKGSF
jgi:hypothetical protein